MRIRRFRIPALLALIVAFIIMLFSSTPNVANARIISCRNRAQKIGYIYVGPQTDMGYNYSMDLGRQYVEANMPNVKTTYFDNVPETAEVSRVMERLIQDGHKIMFCNQLWLSRLRV
jgi:basic membrane lipoprotein Med (substrate-binding protein (PBP1-ABC) superfamily)